MNDTFTVQTLVCKDNVQLSQFLSTRVHTPEEDDPTIICGIGCPSLGAWKCNDGDIMFYCKDFWPNIHKTPKKSVSNVKGKPCIRQKFNWEIEKKNS